MIASFIKDLNFSTKVRAAAQELELPCSNVRDIDKWTDLIKAEPKIALVDLGAGEQAFAAIEVARSVQPGLKVLAFYPHVEVSLSERAKLLGAETMPRSKFSGQVVEILGSLK